MYQGDIPFHPKTGDPEYYPGNHYEWEYQDQRYDSWMEIKHLFGEAAVEESRRIDLGPDWRPNVPFKTRMQIFDFGRGRSAANFILLSRNDTRYTMFLKDMLDLLRKHGIVKGWTKLRYHAI